MTEKEAIVLNLPKSELGGVQTPRIHSKLNDLPSKGQDMIDLATELGINLMEWQRFVCIHGHKVRPDGRWAHSELGLIMARQQGKSTLMMLRILTGMFVGGAVIGLEVAQAVAMAAFAGVIDVAQELSRSYLADGEIDADEINKSFGKIADKTDKKG